MDQFERRQIFVSIEKNDLVIVAQPSQDHRGLTPGEEIVTTGSLILEQMFEDGVMADGALLATQGGEGPVNPLSHPLPVIATGPTDGR